MAEVLFFILGAVFSLMLVMAVLVMLAGQVAPVAQPVLAKTAAPRKTMRAAQASRPEPCTRSLPDPSRATQAEREAYKTVCALELAERALSQIARNGESAAAKIAAQTLRRLSEAGEPPAARLRFARARLDLLALRPEPRARAQAVAALHALA